MWAEEQLKIVKLGKIFEKVEMLWGDFGNLPGLGALKDSSLLFVMVSRFFVSPICITKALSITTSVAKLVLMSHAKFKCV